MLPTELDFRVRQEQRRDQLRALQREQLIRMIERQRGPQYPLLPQVLAWLGGQLVNWGSRLQSYASTSSSHATTVRVR